MFPFYFLFPLLLPLLFHLPLLFPPPLSRLRNKHIWIIGATRGLGLSLSTLCAANGAKLSISSRSLSPSTPLVSTLRQTNSLATIVPLDITADWKTLKAAFDQVQSFAPLDILIVNAGINHSNNQFHILTEEQIDNVIATNFTGVTRMLRLAITRIQTGGTLCVVGSLAGYRGVAGGSVYGATKAAVRVLIEALGVEVANRISVFCACPGFVDTDAIAHLKHPKPCIMTPDQAATEVLRGIVMRWRVYAFPWIMQHGLMTIARAAPVVLYESLLRIFGK